MESHDKKRKVVIKDDHVSIELTAITLNDEESSDRRQVMGKDVGAQTELTAVALDDEGTNDRRQVMSKSVLVQTELTAITFDDEETNYRRLVISDDVEINSDSPHMFDRIHLNLNEEETVDQRQVAVAMEDSGNAPNDSMTKNRRIVEAVTE